MYQPFKEQKHLSMFRYKLILLSFRMRWTFPQYYMGLKDSLVSFEPELEIADYCPILEGFVWTKHSGLSKVCFQLCGSSCWSTALRCRICNLFKNTAQTATCLVTARHYDSFFPMLLRCGCHSNRYFCSSSINISLTSLAVPVFEENRSLYLDQKTMITI